MAKPETISVPLNIKLQKDAYEKLCADMQAKNPGTDASAGLSSHCNYFLLTYADGGFMLRPSDLRQLKVSTGREFASPAEIVKAVQMGENRDDGLHSVRVNIDPSFIEPLTDMAKQVGWTVQEFITDAVNTMMTNGWLYELTPGTGPLFFSDSARASLDKIMGRKAYTGADVLAKIKAVSGIKTDEETPVEFPAVGPPVPEPQPAQAEAA